MNEETKEKIGRVEELVRGGMAVTVALKTVGVASATYYGNRSKIKKTKRARFVDITSPAEPTSNQRLMVMIGSPEQVKEVVRSLW